MQRKGLLIRLNQIKTILACAPSATVEEALRRGGFKHIGAGSEATVYAKPNCHWVAKVMRNVHRGFKDLEHRENQSKKYPEDFAQFVFERVNGTAIVVQERMTSVYLGYGDKCVTDLCKRIYDRLPKVSDISSRGNSGVRRGGGVVALDWVSGEIPCY